jgi:hypothetical protein
VARAFATLFAQVISHCNALKKMSDESKQAVLGWRLALGYGLVVADTGLDRLERGLGQTLGEPFTEEAVESARDAGAS